MFLPRIELAERSFSKKLQDIFGGEGKDVEDMS